MATVQLKGLSQLKTPMTSLGIKLATFQLAAYCLFDDLTKKKMNCCRTVRQSRKACHRY
jgi:hypothetical protein